MVEPSVQDLVRRASQRDAGAFALLIRRFERTALAIAYAVAGDADVAADVVQDAFCKAWERLKDLRDPDRFAHWLCGIVRNLAIDQRRRGGSEVSDVQGNHADVKISAPSDSLDRQEQAGLIDDALARLDDLTRAVVVLRYYENLSSREIAGLLDLTAPAVDMRLSRARQQLRECLWAYAGFGDGVCNDRK